MIPTKRGFEVWCLCESSSGYLLSFSAYTGATEHTEFNLGEKVILHVSALDLGIQFSVIISFLPSNWLNNFFFKTLICALNPPPKLEEGSR